MAYYDRIPKLWVVGNIFFGRRMIDQLTFPKLVNNFMYSKNVTNAIFYIYRKKNRDKS